MRNILLLLALLIGMIGSGSVFGQITPNGNSGASTTAYTNGMPNDPIYIWCAYGLANNTASLTATPPSGTGPWTFKWYYHNQTTASWSAYTTATGTSSTVSNLASDGYRVEIYGSNGVLVGCYTAWVWNMNTTINAAANPTSCNSANLVGTLNVASSFSYYNPPPPESIITAATQITVCFKATHTYVSDLAFYLVGPASCGSPVILLSPNPGAIGQNNICNSGNNVNNLCFSKGSTATLNVCNAAVPLTGTYGRYGPSNTPINWTPLNGCNAAAGGWRVQIYDCIGADVGALTNATISFSNLTPVCGSPTTITYNSGTINSAINDNSCTAASASIFQVPPATALTAPITINANTVYQWTASPTTTIPGATSSLTPSVTGIPSGTTNFTLTATVSYGGASCTYTSSTSFTNNCCTAVSNAGPDVSFCSGGSAVIGTAAVPGRTYSWSPTTGLSNPNIAQPTVSSSTPGTTTYTLTVTNTVDGGCTATDPVNVTVNTTPTVTATPSSQAICSGTAPNIVLTSVPSGAAFSWTVAQSGVSGGSAGSGGSIGQTLSTTGPSAGTATYTVTPALGTCVGTPVDVTITVNPAPVVTATPSSQTICSGTAPNITLSSVPAGATFSWTISQTGASGASNGTGSTISQPLTATGAVAGNVTYTVTPLLGTCAGTPVDVTITVNPVPVVTASPQTICSGTSTSIALTSVPAGSTFAWTVVQSGVTGASAGAGTSITQTLSTTGTSAGTATYTVTPTLGTCPGTPVDVTVTVNPVPVVTATPSSQAICSGTSTGITLSSVPVGATFDWTVVQTGVTGASAGSGSSITQTLTATGTSAGTATYTVTPMLGTCPGTSVDVTVTVNPTPVVTATPASQAICSGNQTGIALSSVPAGATFDWTVVQTGVTGASAGSGSSITQTLTTSGNTAGTATYTITPMLGTCPGTPLDVTVTVNPVPVVTATPSSQAICSGTSTGIALTSVPAGATFDWTVVQTGVTGASAGSGSSITQTLTASGTTGTATYTITPTLGTCPGIPVDVTITVNPTPVVTATPSSQAICSGTSTGITLTSVPAGATFDWAVVQSGASGAAAGSGTSITQTLSTTGTAAGTVTYTVTPTLGTCPGTPLDITVTVNPVPVVTATPASQAICSGTSTGIALTSVPAGATFDWTVVQTGVTGASAGSGNSITQTLTAFGTTGTATYTVTPTLGTCPGTPIDITVTVNPTPVVTATPSSQAICSGTSTGITLTSVPAGATFAWTVNQTGATGASAGTGSSITQTLTAIGTSAGTVTYSITPALGTCTGSPVDVTITVNPTPVVTATPSSQAICSGTATGIALTSVPAGATFDWTVVQTGVTGASAGSGNSITQTLTTSGTTAGTATYTVTPTLGSCPGTPVDVTITVNPVPVVTATPASQAICSGTSTGITLTSVPAGATFAWTVNQTGVTGASAGTGSSIAQTLTAAGASAGTATYSITPSLGTCAGTPVDVTITVNPTPVVTATPATQTICSGTATGIALSSVPAGATFDWTVVQTGVTGASAGSGTSITQTLSTAGTAAGTATYTVTPMLGTCPGTPVDVTITVNPTPVVTATPATQSICSGTATGITLSSVPSGATFDWTVVQAGITGASAGTGSNITQTLSLAGTAPGTATYTITPTLGVCAGPAITATVTVNPTPVVTATPASQTICSGTATGIALSSAPAGATFDWTVVQTGTTGASAGSGSSITQTLTTSGTTAGTATYTITPALGTCQGAPVDVTITVNPTPVVTATPATQAICSGTATGITLSSVPSGATFDWTVVQTGITGASAGTGSSITQTLTTSGTTAGTATYTITPTLGVCAGPAITATVTVNPTPVVTATPATQTICSGTATGITMTSVPSGATFDWTVVQTGVTGASAGTGTSIAQTLTTSGTTAGTATYTITPSLGTCQGAAITATVTVNPTPVVTATPSSQTICSGTATGITLTSVPVGATFDWTVVQSGVTGASAGSGSSITQTLSTTGTTSGTATYTITPTLGSCQGTTVDVTITVNPTPAATATPATQTICSGTAPGIALTSVPVGATFSWTVTQTGVSGAGAGSGSSIAQILTATGAAQGTAAYTVTPTLGACSGSPVTVTITVNPTPAAVATPSNQTICSGTAPGIALTSVPAGATFSWTVSQIGTTGATAGTGSSIAETLTATGAAPGTATYSVTPSLNGCAGLPVDVIITVNPLPVVTATPASPSICSGQAPGIALTSMPTGAGFTWTAAQTGAAGASNGSGSSIAQTLTASSSTAPGTVTYSITPLLNGCIGAVSSVTVTVNPNPVLIANPTLPSICAGSSVPLTVSGASTYSWTPSTGLSATTGSSVTASPAATQAYAIQGTDANGCQSTANVIVTVNAVPVTAVSGGGTVCAGASMNLTAQGAASYSWSPATGLNTTTGPNVTATPSATTTYTVTGTSNNCSSTATVTVTVNPLPVVSAGSDITVCSGATVVLSGSGATPGSYIWSGGVTDGTGFVATATTTYTVVGTGAGGCTNTDQVTVTVVNAPVINIVPSTSAGCAPVKVNFQNNTQGAVTYAWDFGDGGTSSLSNPSHTYISTGCFDVVLTASTAGGCTSTATFPGMVCVEPSPVASFIANPVSLPLDNPVSSMINTSQNATSYSWDFGDGTPGSTDFAPAHTFPTHSITNYEVMLVAYSSTGCTDTAWRRIEIYEDILYFVPNAFTPDYDDYNQVFKPVFTSGFDPYSYTLLIYDRWGAVLFESHDADVGWRGTYGPGDEILMDGTYVWVIDFKVTQTGERRKINGQVTLLR